MCIQHIVHVYVGAFDTLDYYIVCVCVCVCVCSLGGVESSVLI